MDETTTSGATSIPNGGENPLSTLLSDPEWMGRMQGILSSAIKSAEASEPAPQSPPLAGISTGDGLAGLLNDPALLAKLPQILATVKPLLSGLSAPAAASPHKEEVPKSIPVCRDNLLLALKPFLSPKRCEAVDSMLRIAKLGEILGRLK